MKWSSPGPKLTRADIAAFEKQIGATVPPPIEWFLTTITNGGVPWDETWLPVTGLEGNQVVQLGALFGINDPSQSMDLARTILNDPTDRFADMWPLAHDAFGNLHVWMRRGPNQGQVRFIELDDYHNESSSASYLIAPNIRTFASLIEAYMGREPA
jgi:hypothetical protein